MRCEAGTLHNLRETPATTWRARGTAPCPPLPQLGSSPSWSCLKNPRASKGLAMQVLRKGRVSSVKSFAFCASLKLMKAKPRLPARACIAAWEADADHTKKKKKRAFGLSLVWQVQEIEGRIIFAARDAHAAACTSNKHTQEPKLQNHRDLSMRCWLGHLPVLRTLACCNELQHKRS